MSEAAPLGPRSSHVDLDPEETGEWLEALDSVLKAQGTERAYFLMGKLRQLLPDQPVHIHTPYRNTIPPDEEPAFPGDLELEQKIRGWVRWNAFALVLHANKESDGIGGHLSSYASAAMLYETAYNHFFRGPRGERSGDQVFSQGHVSPGIYARAFVEGILSEDKVMNFRRELKKGGGLSSYPHPRLMPDFWQWPTVSMGLGPITSLYVARFNRYLHARGLKDTSESRVWAFLGDGELDEPETLGMISFGVREKLDNLIWVVNCNLQRLDGPVRGNGSVIRETEGIFRGAGWNVIKVLWGENWDPLFAKDKTGALERVMASTVDGEYQRFAVASGAEKRRDFFGKDPDALKLVEHLSDDELQSLRRGGHDAKKIYAAYHRATTQKNGRPTVILVKTVKGFQMGKSGEAKNIAHQQKKMDFDSLKDVVEKYGLPMTDEDIKNYKLARPAAGSPEAEYLKKIRERLGPFIPRRNEKSASLPLPPPEFWAPFREATKGKGISTTMAFVRVLSALLARKDVGRHIVPIIPDEARTFGMEGLFRQYGIYAVDGQLYRPVDQDSLTPYHEAKDGQIFQEGISEAGALSTFIAAGTAYSHQGVPMVPFYPYYSMFGFQRVGDLIWAASDMKCKGFLMGGTSGRTTLNGEGLQHEDGHSPILASTFPNISVYDPAWLYEMALVLKDGWNRMYTLGEDHMYYVCMYNENYEHPAMPEGVEEGVIRGLYLFRKSTAKTKVKLNLLSSGVTFKDALAAADLLEKDYGASVDVWSAPSFKRLREETLEAERWNKLHPTEKPRSSWLLDTLQGVDGTFVAATDYMRAYPEMIAPWVPGGLYALGTDGFGLSSTREELREHFEVNTAHIVIGSLYALQKKGLVPAKTVADAVQRFGVDPDKRTPLHDARVRLSVQG